MDIAGKLKKARADAKMTQEQAAEALGVSRQTISNWENDKSYPDIVSVVKMSDLYCVSLDRLLKDVKEEQEEADNMTEYVEYLNESANVVKSKDRLGRIIMVASYMVVWAIAMIIYWLIMDPGDAMGYSLLILWVIFPVMTLVMSIIIGARDYWGRFKWFAAPVFGLMYMLAEYGTFSLANMISFDKFNMPRFELLIAGALISALGIGVGTLARRRSANKKAE